MMFRASYGVASTAVALFGVLTLSACGDDDPQGGSEPSCLSEPGPLDCDALYGKNPTFSQVYTNTLSPRCATSGCHSGPSPAGSMQLGTEDQAFESLHSDASTGGPRVVGGDIQCGKVIVRLETHGEAWSMPPGTPLKPNDLCSVRHWIKNGAGR
jgi:hypothetical protein